MSRVPALAYSQALPKMSALQLYEHGPHVRRWAAARGFVLVGVFIDPDPDRAPRFAEMMAAWHTMDPRPATLIIPHPHGLGAPGMESEKVSLLGAYGLRVVIADDSPGPGAQAAAGGSSRDES